MWVFKSQTKFLAWKLGKANSHTGRTPATVTEGGRPFLFLPFILIMWQWPHSCQQCQTLIYWGHWTLDICNGMCQHCPTVPFIQQILFVHLLRLFPSPQSGKQWHSTMETRYLAARKPWVNPHLTQHREEAASFPFCPLQVCPWSLVLPLRVTEIYRGGSSYVVKVGWQTESIIQKTEV